MTTTIGREMMTVLQNNNSVADLISYIEKNGLFDSCKAIERDEFLYNYQIPLDEWARITGLEKPSRYHRTEYADGAMFVNCYYEADYKEHDSIDYMYLATSSM
jgi:hypothetical protein